MKLTLQIISNIYNNPGRCGKLLNHQLYCCYICQLPLTWFTTNPLCTLTEFGIWLSFLQGDLLEYLGGQKCPNHTAHPQGFLKGQCLVPFSSQYRPHYLVQSSAPMVSHIYIISARILSCMADISA